MIGDRHADRAGAATVLRTLAGWTPGPAPADPLHLGDVGWHLRFEDSGLDGHLVLWTDRDWTDRDWTDRDRSDPDGVVAIGLRDGGHLRLALAPRIRDDAAAADALLDRVDTLLPEPDALIEVSRDSAVGRRLAGRGWVDGDDPMAPFVRPLSAPALEPAALAHGGAEVVTAATAADRVAVQRNSFDGSTFTVERWHRMTAAPGGQYCVDILVRDPDGTAAAAATGWFAGVGRCALLEPVGTRREYQRRGHGRTAVLAACAALATRGASAVAVTTPARNLTAVALYASAGFTAGRPYTALRRS